MSHAQSNQAFLDATDANTRAEVLANVANHYGITPQEAFEEVTDEQAEHLLEYMTGPARAAVNVLMQRHCFATPLLTT